MAGALQQQRAVRAWLGWAPRLRTSPKVQPYPKHETGPVEIVFAMPPVAAPPVASHKLRIQLLRASLTSRSKSVSARSMVRYRTARPALGTQTPFRAARSTLGTERRPKVALRSGAKTKTEMSVGIRRTSCYLTTTNRQTHHHSVGELDADGVFPAEFDGPAAGRRGLRSSYGL